MTSIVNGLPVFRPDRRTPDRRFRCSQEVRAAMTKEWQADGLERSHEREHDSFRDGGD